MNSVMSFLGESWKSWVNLEKVWEFMQNFSATLTLNHLYFYILTKGVKISNSNNDFNGFNCNSTKNWESDFWCQRYFCLSSNENGDSCRIRYATVKLQAVIHGSDHIVGPGPVRDLEFFLGPGLVPGFESVSALVRFEILLVPVNSGPWVPDGNIKMQEIFQQHFLWLQWSTWVFHIMLQSYLEIFGGIMQLMEFLMQLQMELESFY